MIRRIIGNKSKQILDARQQQNNTTEKVSALNEYSVVNKAVSFLRSEGSALLDTTEVDKAMQDKRTESCSSCEHYKPSSTYPDKHICNLCGCGERKILEIAIPKYHYLECPLGMPGFSNENNPWSKVKK